MSLIHLFLDRSLRPTWQYERAIRVTLETLLLIVCAAPVVIGWCSFIAQLVVGALRMHQAETAREKASIISRAKELGFMLEPSMMGAEKAEWLRVLDQRDAIIAWVWPVLVPVVQALETKALGWTVALGIVATLARVAFDKLVMPTWRRSRVEWRKSTFKVRHARVVEMSK